MTQSKPVETVHVLGNLLTFRAYPEDTGEHFALIECLTAPGAGAPPNRHAEDESFWFSVGRWNSRSKDAHKSAVPASS